MPSDISVVNDALIKLGEKRIESFDDNVKAARIAKDTFADIRDKVTEAHPWNFALRRAALAANATAPTWEYTTAYNLPAEPNYCLRVLKVENPLHQDWKVEGRTIITDMGAPLNILYIQRVEAIGNWSFGGLEALSARCALEWAEAITKSAEIKQQMAQLYAAKLQEARSTDGQEGTPDEFIVYQWIESRW
jgi:hypothetical protein